MLARRTVDSAHLLGSPDSGERAKAMRAAWWWACGLGMMSLQALADEDLTARRIEAPASLVRGGSVQPLAARSTLATGDRVETGSLGRVGVQIAGGGSLTLGGDARFAVQGSERPDPPGRSALVRARLEAGALHVDARKTEQGAPADLRLEQRYLTARLYGTDAWAEVSASGDELCVLAGAAEVQTPVGHERLDEPGECLRWTAAGGQRLAAAEVGALAPRLTRATFSDDYAMRYAAAQALRDGSAHPSLSDLAPAALPRSAMVAAAPVMPAPAVVAAAPAQRPLTENPAAKRPAASKAAAQEWRIVLASFPDAGDATRAAKQWRERGYAAEMVPMTGGGKTAYRVLAGHHATQDSANRSVARVRQDPHGAQAWVVQTAVR
jgi:cell division septation protein DedD